MTTNPNRQTRKRLATRQNISDTATHLFFKHGFDTVTIDEIAQAADVGRMTVFSHFPRKEDMFFDQDAPIRALLIDAVKMRNPAQSPIDAIHQRIYRLIEEKPPYLRFFDGSQRFIETVTASKTLMARARAIRDEITQTLAQTLAETMNQPTPDPHALLAASLMVATVSTAFISAQEHYRNTRDSQAALALFLSLTDQGLRGTAAAMKNTPYATPSDAP